MRMPKIRPTLEVRKLTTQQILGQLLEKLAIIASAYTWTVLYIDSPHPWTLEYLLSIIFLGITISIIQGLQDAKKR